MLGKVASSRLTFTKSNEELNPILVGLTKLRSNMGLPEVKRYETDNAAGDRILWKKHFLELRKDVVEYVPLNLNLGFAYIDDKDYKIINSYVQDFLRTEIFCGPLLIRSNFVIFWIDLRLNIKNVFYLVYGLII